MQGDPNIFGSSLEDLMEYVGMLETSYLWNVKEER